MAGFFYQLGRLAGPKIRKAKWVLRSLTGTEAEAIQAEFEAGRDLSSAVAAELGEHPDASLKQLLNEIGQRLASKVANPHRKFAFHALASPDANAFALPGGFIWVSGSLLDLCGGEPSEVAFVLGHEMGHVIRKHAFDRLVAGSAITLVTRATPVGGILKSQISGILSQLLHNGYSQDQEIDADQLGVRLARSAGYDPAGAVRLFKRLLARSADPSALGAYFSTHPPFSTRIEHARRLIESLDGLANRGR